MARGKSYTKSNILAKSMYQKYTFNAIASGEEALSNPVQQLNDGKARLVYA